MAAPSEKVMLASYGTPGVLAIEHLFARGLVAGQIRLLTHPADERNTPLRSFADANGIESLDAPARTEEAFAWVRDWKPDVLFSLHYRQRIPGRILAVPPKGAVNLHPSLLPKYRGCLSIPWAIINGESHTGFTYHFMAEDFDTGNILLQVAVPIGPQDTAFSLFHKMIVLGLQSFDSIYDRVVLRGDLGVPQPAGGNYYPRGVPFGGAIDPAWDRAQVERFIRAMIFPPLTGAILRVGDKEHEVKDIEQYDELVAGLKSGTEEGRPG